MRALFVVQGIYFALTGIWPVLHIASFMAVTGPKTDIWLVKNLGLVLFVSGIAYVAEGFARNRSRSLARLAVAQAIILAGVDIHYSTNGTIHPVYLVDAAVEFILVLLWAKFLVPRRAHDRLEDLSDHRPL